MYTKIERPEQKLTCVSTIQYDVKPCQFIMTIVNCTDVRLKILKILTANRRNGDSANKYLTQL